MFPIRCDHRRGVWPFTWRCRKDAAKFILHYPVYGLSPDVLLLCQKHFDAGISHAEYVLSYANSNGNPLGLSALVKDAGDI
jgi:hypothetical protein